MTLSSSPLTILLLLPWALLWAAGGVWLVRALFTLETREELVIGLAVGWIAQNWLANLLVWVVPVPWTFWASALIIFLAGLLLARRSGGWRSLTVVHFSIPQIVVLGLITLVYFSINRGMAIFDDFAHLPTVSIMAAGDIPPHFSLDPNVIYGYHHFLLLLSAQVIRVASLTPWVALDLGRALSFGTAVMLAALFAQRLTGSQTAGFLGGLMMAFGSGTRWLMLLLPRGALVWLSQNVHMLGSGAGSGASLPDALLNTWAVEGGGPVGFPFAFANGIYPPGVINGFSANGLTGFAVIFLLLLTFDRWRGWGGAVLSTVLISVWGLLGEAELVGVIAGWGTVALAYGLRCKSWRLPRALWAWLGIAAAGCAIGFVEGGAWTDLLIKTIDRLSGKSTGASYQTIGFQLSAPAVVSSHLGVLPLFDPRALVIALLELGPVLLVLPLLAAWGIRAFRSARWYEAATSATALVMLLMVFVQFAGSTGVRNTPRLYVFMAILAALAVPLAWNWAVRRSDTIKTAVAGLGLFTMLGGMVMFGTALAAIQRPVYSYFITPLDARMTRAHWNQLEPGALVFDHNPSRATTILGRPTDSAFTWYAAKPQWEALKDAPDPVKLRTAGYRYLYMDEGYWDAIGPQYRQAIENTCAALLDEAADGSSHFRRLYDLEACH